MTDQELLTLALTHLDAAEHDLGDHGHHFSYVESQGSTTVYLVTDEDMLALGEDLDAGQADAYSHWCADTCATECTISRVLTLYISRDPDALEAQATESGDVETLAVLAHLRDDMLALAA